MDYAAAMAGVLIELQPAMIGKNCVLQG